MSAEAVLAYVGGRVPQAAADRLAAALEAEEAFYATRFPVLCALIERELAEGRRAMDEAWAARAAGDGVRR